MSDTPRRVSRRQFVKNSAVLGISATTVGGFLAACGDSTPTGTTSPTAALAATTAATTGQTSPVAVTSNAGSIKGEVVYWDWQVSQGPTIDREIQLFQQAYPAITIKKTTNSVENFADLIALAFKSGSAPDVFEIPLKPTFQTQVGNRWLADLTKFPDWNDFKNSFPDPGTNFAEGTNTIGGKTYTAPYGRSNDAMGFMLWLNTKVFKDAGIVDANGDAKAPETLQDVLSAARQIKGKSGGKVYGYGFGGKTTPFWGLALAMAQLSGGVFGGDLNGFDYRTGKYIYSTTPAYKSVIDTILTMRDEGLILPESTSIDDEAVRLVFAQNKFAMYWTGTWIINSWKKAAPDFKDYTIIHPPLVGTTQPTSYAYYGPGGSQYAISAQSKNSEASWLWFKWLYSKDAGSRWVKGGNGFFVHPESNVAENVTDPALKVDSSMGPQYSRLVPQPTLRNPDVAKVQIPSVKPDEDAIMQALYTGQLKDVAQALKSLDDAKQKALEQAIADAKAAGANVTLQDYIFPDWDPTKNYTTTKKG